MWSFFWFSGVLDQLQILWHLYLTDLSGFNRSGATRAAAFGIFKNFDRVWHAGFLHKLKSYGISGRGLGLISSFLSSRRLRMALAGKSSQEYHVNDGVTQGSSLGSSLLLLCINYMPGDAFCNIDIYADYSLL